MGLNIKSPCVLASLTMMSNVKLENHICYYKKVIEAGAGAIVLPSVNPIRTEDSQKNISLSDCLMIETGLKKSDKMGFTVLGTTYPNIVPVSYGKSLAESLCSIPQRSLILGSVANIGNESQFMDAVKKMCETNIDAIELNFSCPNVIARKNESTNPTVELLKNIRSKVEIPISLKLTPYENHILLLEKLNDEIDGITLSNAYIGLIPPDIDNIRHLSPFDRYDCWSPSGIYGPFEKMLTFYHLYEMRELADKKGWDIASVGGYVSCRDIIQGIMLGADVIELSSAIAWRGISFIEECNRKIEKYIIDNDIENINGLNAIALEFIKKDVDSLGNYDKNHKVIIDYDKCKKCNQCFCCNKMCLAVTQGSDKNVKINYELCSGCTWCYNQCPNKAIQIVKC